ncbi:MAG: hypothetical protein AAF367_16660 [Pseudomonadota bacterium]
MKSGVVHAVILVAPTLLAARPAYTEENIRILPDQAVLACVARAEHDLMARGGEAMSIQRYDTEPMKDFMQRVTGRVSVTLDGVEREVQVICDVSSSKGVEVFTMEVMPSG